MKQYIQHASSLFCSLSFSKDSFLLSKSHHPYLGSSQAQLLLLYVKEPHLALRLGLFSSLMSEEVLSSSPC